MVAEISIVSEKIHELEFKPVYISSKGGFRDNLLEYEAWLDETKIPIRYKRFNLH